MPIGGDFPDRKLSQRSAVVSRLNVRLLLGCVMLLLVLLVFVYVLRSSVVDGKPVILAVPLAEQKSVHEHRELVFLAAVS